MLPKLAPTVCLSIFALLFSFNGPPALAAVLPANGTNPHPPKISPAGLLNPDGTLNLDGKFSGALDLEGWQVQIDPERGPVFAPGAGDEWFNLGSDGVNGSLNVFVRAIAVSGKDVYVGGGFTDVNNNGTPLPEADHIARWDGSNWSALGSDGAGDGALNQLVTSIAVSGTDVYVGGHFKDVNNNGTLLPEADHIARWDGSNWSALGSNGAGNGSLNDPVYAVAVSGTDVYVGGFFEDVNDNGTLLPEADKIAKWDGSNWSSLGSNGAGNGALNLSVYAIAVSGTDVYVGGNFTDVNNNGMPLPEADFVARWDGSNWSALSSNGAGNGALNEDVRAIAVSGTDVYVGGSFTDVNDNGTPLPEADYIARWDGSNWSALGSDGAGNGALDSTVMAIAVSETDVYVGGYFTDVNDNGMPLQGADHIVRWDGSNWSALGSDGAGNGALNDTVLAIAISGTDVYAGGHFINISNNGTRLPEADRIASWDGSNWSALGSSIAGNGALNSWVLAIAVSGTDVYVGGYFTDVNNNGTLLSEADYIARWDGSNWSALGSNGAGDGALNDTIFAIAVSGTDVYVGGFFTDVNNNGIPLPEANYIARWDGSNWSSLGSNGAGNGALTNYVYAIAISGTDVYVGGPFINVNNNGTPLPEADYIARWDGSNWSALGSDGAGNGALNDVVTAIAVSGTGVYVGGFFTDVNNNGMPLPEADFVARWDGSNWSALGSDGAGNGSLNAGVFAIVVSGTDVYVGGNFTDVNNNGMPLPEADHITRWDGSNWSALGSDGAGDGALNEFVTSIAVSGTDVYAGGGFWDVNNNGTVLPAADFVARYLPGYLLTVSTAGSGTGLLTSDPPGINCGQDCMEVFLTGTVVTVTAQANPGSTFTDWTGDCKGSGDCVVTMSAASNVTATFTLDTHYIYLPVITRQE